MNAYKPLLTDRSKATQSYAIANLFYVACIGGIGALIFMGIRNARMLQIRGTLFYGLLGGSLLVAAAKYTFLACDAQQLFTIPRSMVFPIFKLTDLLLFLVYYHALKVPYRLHMIYHAEYRLMLHRSLAFWACLLSGLADLILYAFLYLPKG